ncbi:hypothetical protein WT12_08525 [Burkholderia territorii]|uniref:hypothetical protein n=1 Tax=Burkholderia territorii TaxID=1503055 RepID=UPI000757AE79|nr:hypothetical protein [Burkholderia territorii]KVN48780.1 hypothetical protein WT12_08525 [Burkholderia territorii]
MNKTEQTLRAKLAACGFATFTGKRAFDVIERMERDGKLRGMTIQRSVYNANGVEFRSQYNSPKSRTAYEITVSALQPVRLQERDDGEADKDNAKATGSPRG